MKVSISDSLCKNVSWFSLTLVPILAQADIVEDSKAAVEFKNYYYNRDFRSGEGQSKREEWAQGVVLRMQSGYTEGPIGFGLDAVTMLGLKLDSSPDRSGSGLLARDNEAAPGKPGYARKARNEYSKIGMTGKVRFAQSQILVGYQVPDMPTLQPNRSRLFPQSFTGTSWSSQDISDLALAIGQLDQVKQRDSTDYEDMGLTGQSGAYKSSAKSDQFRYAGGDYKLTPTTLLSYQYAQLESIYEQHYVGFKDSSKIGPGTLKSEIRYFNSKDEGAALAGKVDNQALSSSVGYAWAGHTLSGGYQKLYGSTPFAYVDGTNTYLFTEYQYGNFSMTGERAWHARYDFDFAEIGIPGLQFSGKYANGDHAQVTGFTGEGREWERNLSVAYTVQTGSFKNLSFRWQNANATSNYARDVDENRVIIGYTVSLW